MPLPNYRKINASKLNTEYLYTKPYRGAIPSLQFILFLAAVGIFSFGMLIFSNERNFRDFSPATTFAIWCLIPLILLLYSFVELYRRYQRLTTAQEATISSSLILLVWLGYGLLTFPERDWFLFVLAGPGIALSAMYVGFAGDALRRQRKMDRLPKVVEENANDVELDTRRSQPPAYYSAGPSRPPFERTNTSQEVLTTSVQPEKQAWSPV